MMSRHEPIMLIIICDWLWENLSLMHNGKYLVQLFKCNILRKHKATGSQSATNLEPYNSYKATQSTMHS